MHMMNSGYGYLHQTKRFRGTDQDYDDYEERGHHFPSQHDLDVIENLEILPEFPPLRATVTPPESPFAQQQHINSDGTGFETFTTFDQSSYAYNLSPDAPSFQNYTTPSRYYQLYHHNHESLSTIARPLPIIKPEVHRTNSMPAQTELHLTPTQEKPKDMSHHYFTTAFEMKAKGPTKAGRPSVEPLSPKEEALDCYQIPMDFKRTRRNAVFVSREETIVDPVDQTVAHVSSHPKSGNIPTACAFSSQSPRSHYSTKPETITNLFNSNCNGKRAFDSSTSSVTSSSATTTAASLRLAFPAAEAISKTEDSDPVLKMYSLNGNDEITTQKITLSIPDEQQPQRNEHRQGEQSSTFEQSNTPSSSPASSHSAHDAFTISALSAVAQQQRTAIAITSARRTPPVTNNKQKLPTQSKPGPKPYLPPKILFHDEATGEELLQFEYSINSQKLQFIVTVPPIQLSQLKELTIDLSREFKATNAVYPKACLPRDQYKGNRYSYEQETNEVGWILCDANDDLLGQKGLIQRAVDCWRNTRTDERINSRRVKKQKNK